ncbi:hypothetical protein LJC56_08780 [Christensenellaceae bacterium OttesenSCG-928-K19]|nr:hypothetical protein [Christensenellaceae bacterium OttesenSCG-928-K19]
MPYENFANSILQLASHGVPVDLFSLFSDRFLAEYTCFPALEDLLSGLRIHSFHDLFSTPPDEADPFVRQNTEFNTYEEMLNTACDYFIVHNIV